MTKFVHTAAIAIASLGLLASPVLANHEHTDDASPKKEMTKGDEELAKLLEGRTAGEPQSCVRTMPNERIRIIDDTAIVVGRGKTIYVNTTAHPEDLDDSDVLVVRRFTGLQLCRQDLVTKVDRYNHFYSGNVFMSDFIPYTRVEDSDKAKG